MKKRTFLSTALLAMALASMAQQDVKFQTACHPDGESVLGVKAAVQFAVQVAQQAAVGHDPVDIEG